LKVFLLHHSDDLNWVRRIHGPDAQVIAHEDYLPVLLGEAMPCFFKHSNYPVNIDEEINFISHNWHRDETGRDLCVKGGLSVAEAFSTGLWITIAGLCREYLALKHWCDRFDCVYVSCNEPIKFLEIAKRFPGRVQVYDPGHRQLSMLSSFNERELIAWPLISRRSRFLRNLRVNFIRNLQTPFLWFIRNKTLSLSNWTLGNFVSRHKGWILENSRRPWRGAYSRNPPRKYLADAECRVPRDFYPEFNPASLADVLQRMDARWDDELVGLLSVIMTDRYSLYRHYFVECTAQYMDILDAYSPIELVVPSELYEPCNIAVQLAKGKGIKTSFLVDGYPMLDISRRIGNTSTAFATFDRVYAVASQQCLRLFKNKPEAQEIFTLFPPILENNHQPGDVEKDFDVIIMTWIPFDLGINGRCGSCPNTLLDALRVATEVGLDRLAIKSKHHTEKKWLLPLLEKAGYLDKVTILEGPFSDHVKRTHKVIGGISSAVAEAAYHGIPYYIYEPIANGFSAAQVASCVIVSEGGVARNPAALLELLSNPKGSVVNDSALLFGADCLRAEWTWDQTRELYTSWAADWADGSGIKNALQWRGFPLWWSTNLVAKDAEVDFGWYQALHERLCGLPSKQVASRSHFSVYAGIFKSLLKEVGKWLLLKLLPKTPVPIGDRVWFHSLEYNFINAREGFCDRMYAQTPLEDSKHSFTSAFIVRLNFKAVDFFHPLRWRKKVSGLAQKLQREVVILDRHLQLGDIYQAHVSLIVNYFRFTKIASKLKQHGLRIGHAEFGDILVSEMQKSFTGMLPWSLTYSAMFERWLQGGGDKALVTYGETLAPMRAVYSFTKKNSCNHRWISIQHSTVYKNKLGFYHRHSEFHSLSPEDGRSISPMPDYYFVHGAQFADILTDFYPSERIRIVGCLKFDGLYRLYGQAHAMHRRGASERIILLAPSVGDVEYILKIFTGLEAILGWRVILSKHPAVSQGRIDELIRRNSIKLKIGFDATKSTTQLMETVDLVVCGNSSIALESYFVGVPSVRVLSPQLPPLIEDELGIKQVTTQQEFLQFIAALELSAEPYGITNEVANTLHRYFYKFDGQASYRFWSELAKLDDLPGNQASNI
jgi:hypothetical protein